MGRILFPLSIHSLIAFFALIYIEGLWQLRFSCPKCPICMHCRSTYFERLWGLRRFESKKHLMKYISEKKIDCLTAGCTVHSCVLQTSSDFGLTSLPLYS